MGRADEAVELSTAALAIRRDAASLHLLGLGYFERGELDNAGSLLEEALGLRTGMTGEATGERIEQLVDIGRFRNAVADYPAAETILREALQLQRSTGGAETVLGVRSMLHLARTLHEQERTAQADGLLREALRVARDVVGYDHSLVGEVLRELAVVRSHHEKRQGRFFGNDLLARRALSIHSRLLGDRHRETGKSQLCFAATGRDPVEREVLARRAVETMRTSLAGGSRAAGRSADRARTAARAAPPCRRGRAAAAPGARASTGPASGGDTGRSPRPVRLWRSC